MHYHMSVGCVFLAIGGLLAQQVDFCFDQYCYRSDGELKNVASLKDAQDYCYNNDSTSWLIEIYGYKQYLSVYKNFQFKISVLLNSIGIVTNEWTSVINGQLPSKIMCYKLIFADILIFFM